MSCRYDRMLWFRELFAGCTCRLPCPDCVFEEGRCELAAKVVPAMEWYPESATWAEELEAVVLVDC